MPTDAAKSLAACYRFEERTALVTNPLDRHHGQHGVHWTLTAGDIVRGAELSRKSITAYLAALEPFRALGAPFPTLSAADREAFADRVPDRYDVAMLRVFDGSGQGAMVTEVRPLRLVQVAGQFGWTVDEARRRMAWLEPLGLTVACPTAHCPDEIVCWQDLLALTVYLDGQEPAVSGTVDHAHLASAAADLEETVDAVRSRLDRYAELFGFTLEPSTTDSGEETIVV